MYVGNKNLKSSKCLFLLFCSVSCTVFIPQTADSKEIPQEDAAGGFYFRENHGYYDTMIADIRVPVNALGFYIDDPVPHTRSARPGDHRFFDATFGETFYLLGYDYAQENSTDEVDFTEGVAGFLEGSAHLLLDFDGPSNDVINTDYRIGLGLAGRGLPRVFPGLNALIRGLSWDQHFSWRFKAFHESTHLGDEYSIAAVRARDVIGDPAFQDFRRINVSYEALEIFIAVDHKWFPAAMSFLPEYGRVYGGYRYVEGPGYTLDELVSLPTDINNDEYQTGGEMYFRMARTGDGGDGS
jgi:hypothetical protein